MNVRLAGNVVAMQLDTGAGRSIISSSIWRRLGKPHMVSYGAGPVAYDGHELKCLGIWSTVMETDNKFIPARPLVLESKNKFGLLGRDLMSDAVMTVHYMNTLAQQV